MTDSLDAVAAGRAAARSKAELRSRYILTRSSLDEPQRAAAVAALSEHALGLLSALAAHTEDTAPRLGERRAVGLYRAVRGEVDVAPLAARLRAAGWVTAFPVTNPTDRTLTFFAADDACKWRAGAYGILEPDPDAARVVPYDELFALIAPGVAYTASGVRLGYGGGYYDRAFARAGPAVVRVGVAFACQLADELPAEPHDVRMHYVVTESGVIQCAPLRSS